LRDNIFSEEGCTEEEVEPLEEWMTKEPRDEYCMDDTIQNNFVELYEEFKLLEERIVSQRLHIQDVKSQLEEEDIVLADNEEEVANCAQQQMRSGIQPRTKLDDEIDMLLKLMRNTSKKRYNKKRRTTSKKVQLIEEIFSSKESGKNKNKVWNPGESEATMGRQQGGKEEGQLKHKFWDPGGLQPLEIMIRIS
jgi:hypothetical protein